MYLVRLKIWSDKVKKLLRICLMLIIFGMNIVVVHAKTVSIICPKNVKPGNKFSCTINANHNEEYGAIEGILSYSDGLKYNGFSRSFSNGEIYNNKLSVYDVDLKKGTSKVGTITFTLNKNAKETQTIKLTNLMMYDADSLGMVIGETETTVKIDTSVKQSSKASSGKGGNAFSGSGSGTAINSSKIKSLVINNGEISFKKDITEYEITVNNEVTKLDLDISLESGNSKYTIKGNDNFKEGENLVEIKVTSQSGKETIYKINVNRLSKSNNSLLEKIEIKNYKIDFKQDKFKYIIYTDKKINSLDIITIPNDKNSYVVIGGNKNLKTGSLISIVVQAQDGSTSMYQLYIIEKVIFIYTSLGIGTLLLLIVILGLLLRKKKKKQSIFIDLQ